MAALWKGSINFGLVHVPVALHSAEQGDDFSFHLVDRRDQAPVRYKRVNENTGDEVPWSEVARAYETEDEQRVVLTDEEIKKAHLDASQSVEIIDFVDRSAVAPTYFEKPYYLVPGKAGEKGYVLLRETLKDTGKIAICRVTIRMKEHLAALMAEDQALLLILLRFAHELKGREEFSFPSESLADLKINSKELTMAHKLVEQMISTWDPAQYQDTFRERMMALIREKLDSGEVKSRPADKEAKPGRVIDIMTLLKKSVEEKQKKGKRPKHPGKGGTSKRAA